MGLELLSVGEEIYEVLYLSWMIMPTPLHVLSEPYYAHTKCEPHEKTCLCHMRTTKAQISLRICAV